MDPEPRLDSSLAASDVRPPRAPGTGDTTRPLPVGQAVLPIPVAVSVASSSSGERWAAGPLSIPGYEVRGEVARGGMGVVYRAWHARLGREVAIKVLGQGAIAEDHQRFRLEAQALARLQHPAIVPVHDAGEVGGRPYLVMELVDGETLQARLARGGPLPEAEAARVVAAVARAVDHAHAQGVLHRDLKPSNVLLRRDGAPLLMDFGLARVVEGPRLTQEGTALGTPAFMAPEQARGESHLFDARTDVHGLGATLYALLTGRPPFEGGNQLETMLAVCDREPEPPSRLRPGLGRDVEAVCLRALAKTREERYPSAAALADDLERAQRGQETAARPWSAGERLRRGARGRAAALLVGVALVAALSALPFAVRARAARLRADAAARLEAAEAALRRGACAEAEPLLDAALAHDAAPAGPWAARAEARLGLGDLEGALADAEEALRREPQGRRARRVRAEVRERRGDATGALADVDAALAAGQGSPSGAERARALLLRARACAALGRPVDEDLRAALTADAAVVDQALAAARAGPGSTVAERRAAGALWLARARARVAAGDGGAGAALDRALAAAAADVDQALSRDETLAGAWTLRGQLLRRALPAMTPEGLSRLCKEDDDTEVQAWGERARAVASRPEALACRAALDRALGLDPHDVDARCERAALRLQTADLPGAAEDYGAALARAPDRLEALLGRGYLRRHHLSDEAGAAEDLGRALALEPDQPWTWLVRGTSLRLLQRFDEAIECCTRALALDPRLHEAWNHRGLARRQKGDLPGAIADYRQALELAPGSARSWTNLANAQRHAGDADAALASAGRALEVDPGFARAHAMRGLALLDLGRREEARAALQRYLELMPRGHPETAEVRALLQRWR